MAEPKERGKSRFSQKLEAENKEQERQNKMKEKEKMREEKIIAEKGLENKYTLYPIIFGLAGTIMTLFPAGHETQMQWWYILSIFILGGIGYYFAVKANRINEQLYRRYRVRIKPKQIKIGVYLSAFTLFGGMIILMAVLPFYLPME